MDAILSLPALSFLAIPAIGSYSTSLNLLFFYMTWSTLVLSHSPLNVEIFGTLAIRILFFILPSTLFMLFDSAVPSLAVALKAQGDIALPVRGSSRSDGGRKWWLVAGVATVNVLLGVALQIGVELLFTKVLTFRSALKVTTRLPMPWGIFKDLSRGLLLREVLQYYIHRYVLHSPSSRVAKWHQSWQHSIKAPYSFVANYDHPVAWLLVHWLPVYLPAAVFRYHLLTYHMLLALVSLEETFSYSGYSVLPSSFILSGIARRVDSHLMGGGKGNFAPWGIMDWIHGTSVGDGVEEDVRNEMGKHDAQGKAQDSLEQVKAKGKRSLRSNSKAD
ncbi:MAG: hypothetical protein M1819_000088 [Sarea resinae]|nr:MAG: hypothetical protein M1819_000088 [Sarea resinae]